MKTDTIAIVVALLAVGVAVYAVTRKPTSNTTIIQAQKRSEAEQLLTGLGAFAEGLGEGVSAVFQPRIGFGGGGGGSSSSGG